MKAPANVTPLRPESARPEQRCLLLVHPPSERCEGHEPFQHTRRDVSARGSVCGGKGPLDSRSRQRPPSRPPSPQCPGPGLLTANTGRIHRRSKKPFVSYFCVCQVRSRLARLPRNLPRSPPGSAAPRTGCAWSGSLCPAAGARGAGAGLWHVLAPLQEEPSHAAADRYEIGLARAFT